jgi:hypothetical protein
VEGAGGVEGGECAVSGVCVSTAIAPRRRAARLCCLPPPFPPPSPPPPLPPPVSSSIFRTFTPINAAEERVGREMPGAEGRGEGAGRGRTHEAEIV